MLAASIAKNDKVGLIGFMAARLAHDVYGSRKKVGVI
jgi:hypothetical protein